MKKYQATPGYFPSIELFNADRESTSSVWIDGIRAHKTSHHESYHDTFKQAKHYLEALAQHEVDTQIEKLHRCKIALERVQRIKDVE